MRRRRASLKVAGMGLLALLTVLLGLAFIVIGLGLGVGDGDTLGGMDGLVLGLATIFVGAFVLKEPL